MAGRPTRRDGGRPPEPRRLYQQTADRIRALIRDGVFAIHSRLPAERDLAQQLGVSRPSLREALIALEIDGSVEIRMGSGIYVRESVDTPDDRGAILGESPSELIQARIAIEGLVVVQACARMGVDAFDALAISIAAMREAIATAGDPLEADQQFHECIAAHTGNGVLARIVSDLFAERRSRISRRLSTRYEGPGTWTAAANEHDAILAALRARDPLAAQTAMRAHLYQSAARWADDP